MSAIVCGCGKSVPTQPEWAGQWITCPSCGGSLYAPFPGNKPSVPAGSPAWSAEASATAEPTKLCALCAETIPVSEVRCRYCGGNPAGAAPAAPAAAPRPSGDDGLPVLIMALIGLMLCQLVSPIAWAMGSAYEDRCRERGESPSGPGHAGKIIGIVGTVLLGLGFLWGILSVVAQCL